MSKHAYCIIAHADQYCLETLLKLLNDNRNDLYLLFDKKSSISVNQLVSHQDICNLHILDNQIDIRWGGTSQVKAELALFDAVTNSRVEYDYIHLLSGADLPIKNQDEIHNFFDSLAKGTNMIGFAQGNFNRLDLKEKTEYYHLFVEYQKGCNPLLRKFCKFCRQAWISFQDTFGLKRTYPDISELYKGANWISITGELCNYIVSQEKRILSLFKGVPCADEIFLQTIVANSPYANTVFDYGKDFAGGTRVIDWTRGKPYTWRASDFDFLMKSDGLFARKFSSSVDRDIIDKIYTSIKM